MFYHFIKNCGKNMKIDLLDKHMDSEMPREISTNYTEDNQAASNGDTPSRPAPEAVSAVGNIAKSSAKNPTATTATVPPPAPTVPTEPATTALKVEPKTSIVKDSTAEATVPHLPAADNSDLLFKGQESDSGHMEYKFRLVDLTSAQKVRLTNQMKYRINSDEKYGQAVYDIGLTDDGFALGLPEAELEESLKNLTEIAINAGGQVCDIRRQTVTHYAESEDELLQKYVINKRFTGNKGQTHTKGTDSAERKRTEAKEKGAVGTEFVRHVAEVLIRKTTEEGYVELRLGIAGNVDAGKSTLLGVLTKGALDDGRGKARTAVFNHAHELLTGRTSSVGQQIMGFNDKGESVNDVIKVRKPTWEDIVSHSSKIITFFDLAGHEKYLRTTISGITSNRPDYAIIMVGSNFGLTEMTTEHIGLCVAQKVPFMIVMSKIDMAPPNVIKDTYENVKVLIKKKFRKMPYKIENEDDTLLCAKKMSTNEIVPVFMVSNVSGQGLPFLKLMLNYLPIRRNYKKARLRPAKMQVQETFKITGAGAVAGGMLVNGSIKIGDVLKLGPVNGTSKFLDAKVRTIECKRTPQTQVQAGCYVCVGIPNIPIDKVKKGMFLLSPELEPKAIWEFTAKVYIATSNSTNIKQGYQPYCHIGHIKQTCQILEIVEVQEGKKSRTLRESRAEDSNHEASIGAGDFATLQMRFCFRPEVIFEEDKQKFVIREGRMRGEGMITAISDIEHVPLSNKFVTKRNKLPGKSRRERRKEKRIVLGKRKPDL